MMLSRLAMHIKLYAELNKNQSVLRRKKYEKGARDQIPLNPIQNH